MKRAHRAFSRYQSRVISFSWACRLNSVDLAPLSPPIMNLKSQDTPDGLNGVDCCYSTVVITTEAMAIHSSSLCRGENHEMMTKRKIVLTSMRVLVLGQLQRPVAVRTRS